MTAPEKEREVLRKQFEEAYLKCRTDPMEGLSFTEEDMMAAINKSLRLFKVDKEAAPGQEIAAPTAKDATTTSVEVKDRKESEYEEEEEEEYDSVGMFMVGGTVCISLSFLICKYLCPLIKKKNYLYLHII